MLIKMVDGGLVDYADDSYYRPGCPTCDFGSEYINEIRLYLSNYIVDISINHTYQYALSVSDMLKLFLCNCELITAMTEKEFIDWFKEKLNEIASEAEINYEIKEN